MGRWGDLRLRVLSAAVLAPASLLCLWFGGWAWRALVALVVIGLAREWLAMWRPPPVWPAIAGIAGIALAGAALLWLRADPVAGRGNLLFVVLVVWASDIGAYAVGRLIGGPRLAPRISPGKTWAGAAGGLLAAVAVGAFGAAAWSVPAAVLLGAVAQGGDLAESALKRRCGVKDSGALIPGHGGLLDRLDGLLAAAPTAALLALAIGRGVMLWR